MLKTRVITGVFIALILCLVICVSHIPWLLNLLIAALSSQAIFELYRATSVKNKYIYFISYIAAIILTFVKLPGYEFIVGIFFVCALSGFIYASNNIKELHKIELPFSVVMALMIILFYKGVSDIRITDNGLYILILTMLVGVITDIAAYFIGKGFGKHKLCIKISPNKTIEGAVGGALCSVIVLTAVSGAVASTGIIAVNYPLLITYLFLASVVGQIGDLALSAIKRIVGIKDYGSLLPGHGGILDRFDSFLFVVPFTLLFLSLGFKFIV